MLRRCLLSLIAAALLAVGFTGNAGVQVLDGAAATRIAVLHLHGVAGEAEYVRAHGVPAPFIHDHCHKPLPSAGNQPSPDQVLAASALAGSMHCVTLDRMPAPSAPTPVASAQARTLPAGLEIRPAVPPPQG
ncbi:MAG: hypothetical protein AB7R89_24640 [Dehalococcoidia bacterium]